MGASVQIYGEKGTQPRSGEGKAKEAKPTKLSLAVEPREPALCGQPHALAVRVFLQNWRQGSASTKTRGEVSFANKKPWKQKGTGRARAGSARSPIWRSGGVTFGPRPGVRKLKTNRQLRSRVFAELFNGAMNDGRVCCLNFAVKDDSISTSEAFRFLKSVGLENERLTVFLAPDDLKCNMVFRNLPNVNVVLFDQPNVFDLSGPGKWAFLKNDKELFEGMVNRWL